MTTTTEQEIKDVQDYTNVGYGYINNYEKIFTTSDGKQTWNTGRIKAYSFTLNGKESKRYSRRGDAVNAMFKASK